MYMNQINNGLNRKSLSEIISLTGIERKFVNTNSYFLTTLPLI